MYSIWDFFKTEFASSAPVPGTRDGTLLMAFADIRQVYVTFFTVFFISPVTFDLCFIISSKADKARKFFLHLFRLKMFELNVFSSSWIFS